MARPPIIISNQGVCSKLAENCEGLSEEAIAKQIKMNAYNLRNAEVIIIKDADKHVPCVYWRLKRDRQYEQKVPQDDDYPLITRGKEAISINKMVDDFENDV